LQEEPKEKEKEKEKDKKKKKKSKKLFSSPLLDAQSPDPGLRLKVTKFMSSHLSVVKEVKLCTNYDSFALTGSAGGKETQEEVEEVGQRDCGGVWRLERREWPRPKGSPSRR